MRRIIGFHSTKGGVGTTLLAAHACALARSLGIRVVGVSCDPQRNLHRWLDPLGIPCVDGLKGERPPEDAELLVADINTQVTSPPLDPDLWVIPIDCERSLEHAALLSDRLRGRVVWIENHHHADGFGTKYNIPRHLAHVEQILPGVPYSHTIAVAAEDVQIIWSGEHADSGGGRWLHFALTRLLERVGLVPPTKGAIQTSMGYSIAAPWDPAPYLLPAPGYSSRAS